MKKVIAIAMFAITVAAIGCSPSSSAAPVKPGTGAAPASGK